MHVFWNVTLVSVVSAEKVALKTADYGERRIQLECDTDISG